MLLPRPSPTQDSERRGRALSAASYLTDAMEGEEQHKQAAAENTFSSILYLLNSLTDATNQQTAFPECLEQNKGLNLFLVV